MTLLILGLLLWIFSHTFKRILPGPRAALGDNAGKGVVALLSLAGILLMIFGYRMTETIPVYTPVPGIGISTTFFADRVLSPFQSAGRSTWSIDFRHNMVTAVLIWALAHLWSTVMSPRSSVWRHGRIFGAVDVADQPRRAVGPSGAGSDLDRHPRWSRTRLLRSGHRGAHVDRLHPVCGNCLDRKTHTQQET